MSYLSNKVKKKTKINKQISEKEISGERCDSLHDVRDGRASGTFL
jgi:hypothetical protein